MFITIKDASKGKPYTLQEPIDNSNRKLTIGIKSIFAWVGWYNIYEEQTWRWAVNGGASTKVKIEAGLYTFSQLVELLTDKIEGFSITVNKANGLIDMVIPPRHQVLLPEPIQYLLGLENDGWFAEGYTGDRAFEYTGDRVIEFLPKRILVYFKQLSTTGNLENNNQKLDPSQLLGIIPMPAESFGESFTINYEKPHFKLLQSGTISELDFDFKVEWGNGVKHKLDNHSQPIDLVLEIK